MAEEIKRRQPVAVTGSGWERTEPETVGDVLRLLEARGQRLIDREKEEYLWQEVVRVWQYFSIEGELSTNPEEILGLIRDKLEPGGEELPLKKVVEEIDRRIGRAIEPEADLSAKVDTALLRELLQEMDDANARRDVGAEAKRLEARYGKYLKRQTIAEILEAKMAYQRLAEAELKRQRPGASEVEIREIADKRTDVQILAEEKLLHETNEPREKVKVLAQEVAKAADEPMGRVEVLNRFREEQKEVVEVIEDVLAINEIQEKLGEETPPGLTRLAVEAEKDLRPILGEKAAEAAAAVVSGAEPDSVVPKEVKMDAGQAKRVEMELGKVAQIARVERRIETKTNEVADRLVEILEVEKDEAAVAEIRQEVGERVRLVLRSGGELNQPYLEPVGEAQGVVTAQTMMGKIEEEVVRAEVPTAKIEEVSSVLNRASQELRQFQVGQTEELLGWRERLVKRDIFDTTAAINPGVSVTVLDKFAGEAAEIYGPSSGVTPSEGRVWQEANLAGEITPMEESYLRTITHIIRSPVPISTRLAGMAEAADINAEGTVEAQACQGVMSEVGHNPNLAAMIERARRMHQMVGGVQEFIIGKIGSIKGMEGFAQSLAGSVGETGIGFAKNALSILKNSETLAGGIKGILGLVGSSGAGGVVAQGAAALGLSATGVGAVVVAAAALGKVARWIGGKIQNFFSKLGIDLPNVGGLIGGVTAFLGLKGGLGGLIKGAPALLGKAAGIGAGFAGSLMTMVTAALGSLTIPSAAVWGPIVAILAFVLIIIGPLISAMVPPGRGATAPMSSGTPINGYLPVPQWQGDPTSLPEACPVDAPAVLGTITQGPNAISCSHSGLNSTLDIAVGDGTALLTPNVGIISGPFFDPSGYGLYIDLMAKCNGVVYATRFAHLSQGAGASGKVDGGTLIGYTDNTGNSTGSHLHQEIRGLNSAFFSRWEGCCIDNGISCDGR